MRNNTPLCGITSIKDAAKSGRHVAIHLKKKKANLQLDVETEIVHVDHFVQLSTEERTERYSISDNDIFIGKRKNT